MKGSVMKTLNWNEIQAMEIEEVKKLNRKLMIRLVLTRIVLPIAAVTITHLIMKKMDDSEEEI
jgi:hypothetical protein